MGALTPRPAAARDGYPQQPDEGRPVCGRYPLFIAALLRQCDSLKSRTVESCAQRDDADTIFCLVIQYLSHVELLGIKDHGRVGMAQLLSGGTTPPLNHGKFGAEGVVAGGLCHDSGSGGSTGLFALQ